MHQNELGSVSSLSWVSLALIVVFLFFVFVVVVVMCSPDRGDLKPSTLKYLWLGRRDLNRLQVGVFGWGG